MIAVFRFAVAPDRADAFVAQAAPALAVLRAAAGCERADLVRGIEEPTTWLLLTEWAGVGAFRRGLGGFDVRMHAHPFLAQADADFPSAYEPVVT